MLNSDAVDPPEVLDAVMTLIKHAARHGNPLRSWEARDMTVAVAGHLEPVKLGSFKLTVQRTG